MDEQRSEPQYSEWVLPKWSSFLPVLMIYPTLWLTFVPINETVGTISGLAISLLAVALMFAKSARITVTESELRVKNAVIDRKFIFDVNVIDANDSFYARGNGLDFRAWVHFQGSVTTLVRVIINDPEDPTPYWLFSTRNPEELKKVLGF